MSFVSVPDSHCMSLTNGRGSWVVGRGYKSWVVGVGVGVGEELIMIIHALKC